MAETQVYRRRVIVRVPHGLHIRPCTVLARLASRFDSQIRLRSDNKLADAKSVMDLLTLGAEHGMELDLEVDGPDAPSALEHLSALFDSDFSDSDSVATEPPAST